MRDLRSYSPPITDSVTRDVEIKERPVLLDKLRNALLTRRELPSRNWKFSIFKIIENKSQKYDQINSKQNILIFL